MAGASTAAISIPTTLAGAHDPDWLTAIMQEAAPGSRVTGVDVVQNIRVVATKSRVRLHYASDGPAGPSELCIKGFFDTDAYMEKFSSMSATEARFYASVANHVPMRVARSPYSAVDPKTGLGLIVMEDLTAKGARFISALEPIGVDFAHRSVEQLAKLHATYSVGDALARLDWASSVLQPMSESPPLETEHLQRLLDGERSATLSGGVLDAARIHRALRLLAAVNRRSEHTLLHGDCHAGNMFETAEGPGFTDWQLVNRGHWALDLAYHVATILTVEEAEANERALLDHYLASFAAAGGTPPSRDDAWDQYRLATLYGYYLWIVTLRVDPKIINELCRRTGHAMMRHETLERLEAAG